MKKIIIACLLCINALAHAENPVKWDKTGALPIENIQQRLAAIDVKSIKEFTEIFIDISVDKNANQSVQKIRRAYYFPDTNAVQNYGTDSIGFNTGLEQLKILRIVSITPAGKVRNFNPADLKINDTNSSNIFSSTKNAIFTYPGLEVGGFAVLEFEVVRNLQQQESDWFREFYPQNVYPRQDYQLTVNWGQDSPVQFSNDNAHVKCEQHEYKVYCSGKNIPKAESDNNLFWADQLGSVKFGELQSWSQIAARALDKFAVSQQVDQKIITRFVNQLLAGETDLDKKISIIHEFVGQKVQYISLSEHGNSYTPHSVVRTLQKRMGDCKDKTALFYSMLNAIGVDAYPMLVATERRKVSNMQLPSMTYFDHMIICFKLPQGKTACSDPTNYFSDWRYISPYIQDRAALPLIAGAKPVNLPANEYRWFMKVKTELTFLQNGGQSERQTRQYFNEYANYWRDFLVQKNDKDRDQWLIDNYKNVVAQKADVKFSVAGLQNVADSIELRSESTHPPLVDTEDSLDYAEVDAWVDNELDDVKIPNKIYEYNVSGVHIISETIWDISQLWTLKSLPAETELKHEFGSMLRRVQTLSTGKVQITTELKIPRRVVAPKDIERFNKFIGMIKRESSIRLHGNLKTQ